jgi:site-specific DNA-adenine methylase
LFYCDPPYVPDTRGDKRAYGFEMDASAHRELAKVLHECKGKVAISGYHCPLMEELYGDWNCHTCASVKNLPLCETTATGGFVGQTILCLL